MTGDHTINSKFASLVERVKSGKLSKVEACAILSKEIEKKLKGRIKIRGETLEELSKIFETALSKPPSGVLTMAPALQWRMQYNVLAKEDNRNEIEKKGVLTLFEKE